jgi:hypothetical protein
MAAYAGRLNFKMAIYAGSLKFKHGGILKMAVYLNFKDGDTAGILNLIWRCI